LALFTLAGLPADEITSHEVERQCLRHIVAAYRVLPAAPAQAPDECMRSHPHENMDAACALKTEQARLDNAAAQAPAAERECIAGAVARGWCHAQNAYKVMDVDLAMAIVDEVMALAATTAPQAVPAESHAESVQRLRAECDAVAELNHAQWLALENVRLLAARNRKEEWAQHMLRFCAEAGVKSVAIHRRASDVAQAASSAPAEQGEAP
jgi:hypothetical protein